MLLFSIGVVLLVVSFFTPDFLQIYLVGLSYVILTYPIVLNMYETIKKHCFWSEFTLMFLATIIAFLIGKIHEATIVVLLYRIGEYISDTTIETTKHSVLAFLKREDGIMTRKDGSKVNSKKLSIGDILTVEPGEKIPVDGIIKKGTSDLDISLLSGELVPRRVEETDMVFSGSINLTNTLKIEVTKSYSESTINKITKLAADLNEDDGIEFSFFKTFIRWYTPFILLASLSLFLIPTIFYNGEAQVWGYRALIFLVVACPCAFVISIPLGYLTAIYASSKRGVLVTERKSFDYLTKIKTAAFDKTGTLTKGNFKILKVKSKLITEDEFLKIVAHAVYYSKDPITSIIKKTYVDEINEEEISNFKETIDSGIEVTIKNQKVLIGNIGFMQEKHIAYPESNDIGIELIVAVENIYIGALVISDEMKENVCDLANDLKNMGVKKTAILSGDRKDIVEKFGCRLKMDQSYGELLPEEKVNLINHFKTDGITFFIGDGVNDVPVLTAADIGIAMGIGGSDAAIEVSDIIIMNDDPYKIVEIMKVAKFVKNVISENITFAFVIKLLVLIFAGLGYISMWMAIFSDVGVTLICILNTLRIMRYIN